MIYLTCFIKKKTVKYRNRVVEKKVVKIEKGMKMFQKKSLYKKWQEKEIIQ